MNKSSFIFINNYFNSLGNWSMKKLCEIENSFLFLRIQSRITKGMTLLPILIEEKELNEKINLLGAKKRCCCRSHMNFNRKNENNHYVNM